MNILYLMYFIYLINIYFLFWNIKKYFKKEIDDLYKKSLPKINIIGKAFDELKKKND